MSLVRGNSYSRAGIGPIDNDKFEINKSVFILDATAGQGYDAYDDRMYPTEEQTRRESYGISAKHAAMIFAMLAVILLLVLVVNYINIRKLAYEVSIMEGQVRSLSESNSDLDAKVMKAREISNISLNASKMGMVLIDEQEVYHVTAPETRPFAVKGSTNE